MSRVNSEEKYTEFVNIYNGLLSGGMKTASAFESLQRMGYDKSQSILNRHKRTVAATGHALVVVKRAGARPKLNDDQIEEMHEWILDQNCQNLPFGLREFQKQTLELCGVQLHMSTCCKVLCALGHSRKLCQTKTPGFKKTNDLLRAEYWAFIVEMKRLNLFAVPTSEIFSIDATYTRRPPMQVTTYSPVGGGKQKSANSAKLHTNIIITGIWANGVNKTPCLMWTMDPRFRPVNKNTTRGRAIDDALTEALEYYNISRDRIFYIESSKHLVGESPDLYEAFVEFYRKRGTMKKTDLILHDGGNAFKRANVSIFDAKGYTNHVTYPAEVHQYLSPNDNNLHGCKAKWYADYAGIKDSICSSLHLMELIDLDTVKNSKKYFQNNLLKVKQSGLVGIIGA